MKPFRLARTEDVPLVFEGQLLADVSSREPGVERWQEVRIYRTESSRYVTEVVGRSIKEGERDFLTVKVHDDPAEVRTGLYRKTGGRTFLPDLAFEALEIAAGIDPALSSSLVERI